MEEKEIIIREPSDVARLESFAEEGQHLNMYVRVDGDGKFHLDDSTIKRLVLAIRFRQRILSVTIHTTATGRRGRQWAKKQLKPYWDDIALVIYDELSAIGLRSHVRYWTLECLKRLYTYRVGQWDGDYIRMERQLESGERKMIAHELWIDMVDEIFDLGCQHDKWMMSMSDSDNHMDKPSKLIMPQALMRSGCYTLHLEAMIHEMGLDFNPFKFAYDINAKTNEDLMASGLLWFMDKLLVVGWVGILGDRESNKNPCWENLLSAIYAISYLDPQVTMYMLRTFTTRNPTTNTSNEYNSWLVEIYEEICDYKKIGANYKTGKYPIRAFDPRSKIPHIIANALIKAGPNSPLGRAWDAMGDSVPGPIREMVLALI